MSFGSCFVFSERFDVETKYFGQERHAQLGKKGGDHPQPKGSREEGLAEVVGNARAKRVGQRGQEEVERTSESKHLKFIFKDIRFYSNPLIE